MGGYIADACDTDMSRIRYLKPGFFCDEDLADCSPWARLLFAGLWTIADREGRLEDRPRRIRAKVFPYDDVNTDELLRELAQKRGENDPLIIRYCIEGKRYICIPGWTNHQKPHFREVASTIPEPEKHNLGGAKTRAQPCSAALLTGNGEWVTGNGDGNGEDQEPSSDSGESNALALVGEIVDSAGDDFERWWVAYDRIGSKADSLDCYLYWRKHRASEDDLLIAADRYQEHCERTQTSIKHGATFLAKRICRWREWLSEEHGDGHVEQRSGRQVDSTFGALRQLIEEES